MATVAFSGTTIWNDAATGEGRVNWQNRGRKAIKAYEQLLRNSGRIAKVIGINAGQVVVPMQYSLSSAELTSLITSMETINDGRVGTLTVPPGQSFTQCILEDFIVIREDPRQVAGSIEYKVVIFAIFERLR